MPRRIVIRRIGYALGAAAALGAAFTLGVVAGAGSTPVAQTPPSQAEGLLDQAADDIVGSSLLPVDRGALDAAAIKAMLTAAGDQWGSWGDGARGDGSYAGVGLWLRKDAGVLVVAQVAGDSPADAAGVRVGDVLQAVEGRDTLRLAPAEVASMLRGRPGSSVRLVLGRGAQSRSLALTRTTMPALEVTSSVLERHVGRIAVPAFGEGTGRQVREAVKALRLQGVTGIVLDLRGDPGGLLSEAVETASAFLDGGHVVTYARRDEPPQRLEAVGTGDTVTPLVVLVDGGTASAAEVVAGALQDRGRAVLVGSRTFGKGSVQEPHTLVGGSTLELTVASYSLPSGRSVEGVGIEPDIEVAGEGAVLRAVEVLAGLLADAGSRG